MENMCSEEVPVVQQDYVRVITQTPTPPTLSPPALPVGSGEELPVDHILQGKNVDIQCPEWWCLCLLIYVVFHKKEIRNSLK